MFHLKKAHPELVSTQLKAVDAIRQASISTDQKKDLVKFVWRTAGPKTLLVTGQEILSVGYDPIWFAAVRSASPALLFDKWKRFEVFAHSQNRLRIEQTDDNRATFGRYTIDGGTPSAPENLLICGLIISLLEKIGCLDLRCEMPLGDGPGYCIREGDRFSLPDDINSLETASWTIEWKSFLPRGKEPTSESNLPQIAFPESCNATTRSTIMRVIRLLMLDVGRQWKVSDLAREAGLSARSLQRKLSDADLSFSHLVRIVRIHEACRLLKDSEASVTTIAFCAGFSDSAHFSRDFRASMGMSPSNYRAVI